MATIRRINGPAKAAPSGLQTRHNANVAAVLPMPKDQEPLAPSGHYARVIDQGDQAPDAQDEDDKPDDNEGQVGELDLPF